MMLKTFAFSFVLLAVSSLCFKVKAQTPILYVDSVRTEKPRKKAPKQTTAKSQQQQSDKQVRGVQYSSPEEAAAALEAQKKMPLFAGVSISADVCGAVMAACTPYGQYEAAARLNLYGRYFPIFEMGMGVSNHTNETTDLHYKVHSPYYRIGMDYNVAKNVRGAGRIFVGLRYAFSTYKYDVDGPDRQDPIYGTTIPFRFKGVRGTNHWGEAVFGLEARVWGMLHLGWSIRYRMRIYNKKNALGNSWYVPGYGKNDTHALGGIFNVIFDI